MKLSENERQELSDYVDGIAKPAPVCALCRGTNWDISTEVFKLTQFQERSGETALPLCVLVCGNCGNTLFIDARVVGLDLNG